MKVKDFILVALLMFACTSSAFSQRPCTNEDAYNKTGIWKQQIEDDLALPDTTFPRAEYPKVLTKTQKAAELIKKSTPLLIGLDASLQRSIRSYSYFSKGALPFAASAYYRVYYCVPNTPTSELRGTIQFNPEKGPGIGIFFNTLGWITNSDQSANLLTLNNEKIYYYPSPLPDFKQTPAFFPNSTGSQKEMYVLTPAGKTPFVILTREDYILARRKKLQQEIGKTKSDTTKGSKENAEMLAKIESNPVFTAEQKKQFRDTIEKSASINSLSSKATQQFEEWDRAFDKLLQEMSPSERKEPAIVKNVNSMPPKDKIFYSEKEGGRKLFIINKAFFNPALPRDTIQLITLYLAWDAKHPAENKLVNQFKENFNFQDLYQMLGK